MKPSNTKEYYIGLDIGTNSVGWAVTDTNYDIIKKNGKLLAGARVFEEAETAEQRRLFRGNRRRLGRRKFRIDLLQRLFQSEIEKVDPMFFTRLKESALWAEDKSVETKHSLFADQLANNQAFTDKEFFEKYPTNYHLRKALLHEEVRDVRLLYLACHHIVKYRGHFLFEGDFGSGKQKGLTAILLKINQMLAELFDEELSFTTQAEEILQIEQLIQSKSSRFVSSYLKDKYDKTKPKNISKKEMLKEHLGVKEKVSKRLKALVAAMLGDKIDLSNIFTVEGFDLEGNEQSLALSQLVQNQTKYKELKEELKNLSFSSSEYDAASDFARTNFPYEMELIDLLKEFYDYVTLQGILQGEQFISVAMVNKYNKHKADLVKLKSLMKANFEKSEYLDMFKNPNKNNNYPSYIGSNITKNNKSIAHSQIVLGKKNFANSSCPAHCSYEDFLKHLKAVLQSKHEQLQNNADYNAIMQEIEEKSFLRRLNTEEQSVIPYQCNLIELNAILEKQSKHFEFLNQQDKEHELTTAQKIVSLLTFKIPYFVGPLNTAHSENQKGFAWVSKHSDFENKQITPWNYHLAVNETESGERFIERMTSKCTYMTDCNVLPKQSLLYQKYLVLNDLNNLKINGNRISPELKQFLFATLFQISPSVSKSKIKKHLEDWQKIPRGSVIGSEDDDNNAFHANLSSLIKFKQIFGEQFDKIPKVEELCEDIVRWHTIFASEKKMVSHKIEQIYGNILKELYEETEYKKLLGKLKGLSFSGWARFSKEFLTEIFCCYKPTGEANLSLIKALEETNLNLMELLNSDQFEPQYLEKVRQANTKENTVIDYDYVHDLYCSPSVKRSIWQTNKIVDDIVKIMDHTPPKKVFVEVTRQSQKDKKTGKGKVTNSRKNALLKMYENLKEENDLKHILETQSDKDLRGDKLYLYFAQLGKCAYSGKIIDLSKLSSNDYDIDHIYPQSKIKDDSLTNRVLVVKEENAKKGDLYPLPESIQAKMLPTWNAWLAMDLIRKEKYQRLIRKTQLSDGELTAFIDRQMVTTNQAIKEVATMMDIKWNQDQKQTKIVYSKANHVSDFRKKFDIPKSRDVNRLHHAKDAYLNVVVGNVWDTMFGDLRTIKAKDKNKFVWNEEKAINRLFEPTYEKWTRNGEEVLKEKCNKRDLKDAWSFGEDKDENGFLQNHGTLLTVKKWCKENRYLVTTRSFVQKGEMFNQTRHMKQEESKVDTTILLKETKKQDGSILFDPRKYGGYKSANSAYAVCCKSDVMKKQKISSGANKGEVEFVKDGEMITLHPIPIMYAERKEYQNKEKLEQLVAKLYNLTNPTILAEKIPYWSMLEIDDIRYQIRGFSGNTIQLNIAYEWHTTKENEQYVHDIAKYIEMESKKEVVIAEEEKQRQTKIEYANGKIISKEKNLQLYEEIEKQVAKPFYKSYSSKFVNGSKEIKESMKQNFVSLSTYQQVKVLIELMKFITAGGTLANLKAIGGSANETCKVSMSNKITDKKVKWIHQSPTGFYEQSVVLSSGNVLEVNASGGV